MIKNKLYIAFLLLSIFCACNEIDESDRLLDYEPPSVGEKMVLLEEFTGWFCVNCPEGSNEAKRIRESYDQKVVLVSIHAGGFAMGSDYVTAAGEAYKERFYADDREGYPAAMINRKNIDGKWVSTGFIGGDWANRVKTCFELPVYVSLSLESTYNVEDNSVTVISKIKGTTEVKNTNLLIMLTEDGIIGYQAGKLGGTDYVHNHMLRGVIGDKDSEPNYWGNPVGTINTEELSIVSEPYKLDREMNGKLVKWNPEHINIVGVIYDANTFEVLQVAEVKMLDE